MRTVRNWRIDPLLVILLAASWVYVLIIFYGSCVLFFEIGGSLGELRLGMVIQQLISLIPTSISFLIALLPSKLAPKWYRLFSLVPLPLVLIGGYVIDLSNSRS